jgi:hypothetical protein
MPQSTSAHPSLTSPRTHLCEVVLVREEDRQQRTGANEVLHLERIEVRVVGGLVVVEHEVHRVRGRADEDDFKDGVVERLWLVEGPEKVDVSGNVYDEVKEL